MRASVLARALLAATVLLVAGALVLSLASRPDVPLYESSSAIIAPTFAALGALIVSRRPQNAIGWIFLAAGVLGGVQMFSGQYATVALGPGGGALPTGVFAAWLATLAQSSFVVAILCLVLLFPDGRLVSRGWRPVAWAIGAFVAVSVAIAAFTPGPLADFSPATNPFGVEALRPFREMFSTVGGVGGLFCIVAAMLSLLFRYYRSRGDERQQLKWFTYAAVVGISTPLLLSELAPAVFEVLGRVVWTFAFLSLPVSAAIAILRYRLYDIDRIINRTLVYAALTATLVGAYLGSVVCMQYLFRTFAGGESQLAVVASTLAIAALFNPLRRRVQAFVDRRFYRSRYDATRVLQDLSARLRDETDLEAFEAELLVATERTVAPAHASLWLKQVGRS